MTSISEKVSVTDFVDRVINAFIDGNLEKIYCESDTVTFTFTTTEEFLHGGLIAQRIIRISEELGMPLYGSETMSRDALLEDVTRTIKARSDHRLNTDTGFFRTYDTVYVSLRFAPGVV